MGETSEASLRGRLVIGAPGQLKRLGTDAFTASGPESNLGRCELPGMLSSES